MCIVIIRTLKNLACLLLKGFIMLATIVTEIQNQELAVYSYKGNLFSFAKIITENQAKEFVQFVAEEFKTIGKLKEFINPISDELGVISQAEFTMPVYDKNNPTQLQERNCLMLNFGENKTIIFVGNYYEDSFANFIYGTIDFSEKQYYAATFTYLKTKNEQYLEYLEQFGKSDKTEKIYKQMITIADFM
jgi:hypothetical protein